MQRRILIIDDDRSIADELSAVFTATGHYVEIVEDRNEAVNDKNISSYDFVVTNLDGNNNRAVITLLSDKQTECLPESSTDRNIKAFKLCAANFRRDEFDETELKHFIETILDYKSQFIDKIETICNLHEKIEFELPSTVVIMDAILDYLMNRVEKVGIIDTEKSNLFVALDEAFVNAVKHGNKFDAEKLIKITVEVSAEEAKFTIEDEGEGFDVSEIPDPRNPENLFKTSGRGVLFIYNIMDEVKYNKRGNRLEMIKRSEVG